MLFLISKKDVQFVSMDKKKKDPFKEIEEMLEEYDKGTEKRKKGLDYWGE